MPFSNSYIMSPSPSHDTPNSSMPFLKRELYADKPKSILGFQNLDLI